MRRSVEEREKEKWIGMEGKKKRRDERRGEDRR